jgi:recombination protein RecA
VADPARVLQLRSHPSLVHLDAPETAPGPRAWCRAELAGRLCELNPGPASALLTAALALVLDAQREGEPAAWITAAPDTFYPPDAAAGGIDLAALAVVRCTEPGTAGRAADLLLRSGAFGLVVLELGPGARLPIPLQGRLVQLAQKHDAAVVCLADRPPAAPSLGSLVSLRALASRRRLADGRFACVLEMIKDKRRGPGWSCEEVCRGPEGLR